MNGILQRIQNAWETKADDVIITFEGVILNYWWAIYRMIQIYRYLMSYCANYDDVYKKQIRDACISARTLHAQIVASTNLEGKFKSCVCFIEMVDFIENEMDTTNYHSAFLARYHNVIVNEHTSPIANDVQQIPWYKRVLISYIEPEKEKSMGNVQDRIIYRRNNVLEQVVKATTITDEKRIHDRKLYSSVVFLCYFYYRQIAVIRNEGDTSPILACLNKIEGYLRQIHVLETNMSLYMTSDEMHMTLMNHFDSSNENECLLSGKIAYEPVSTFFEKVRNSIMRDLDASNNIHMMPFYNIESFRLVVVRENALDFAEDSAVARASQNNSG